MTRKADRDLPYKKQKIYEYTRALVDVRQQADYAAGVLLDDAMEAALALDYLAFGNKRPVSRQTLLVIHDQARRQVEAEAAAMPVAAGEFAELPAPEMAEVAS